MLTSNTQPSTSISTQCDKNVPFPYFLLFLVPLDMLEMKSHTFANFLNVPILLFIFVQAPTFTLDTSAPPPGRETI